MKRSIFKRQFAGVITLSIILVAVGVVLQFKKRYIDTPRIAGLQAKIDSVKETVNSPQGLPALRLHAFDPNKVDSVELLELGFSPGQTKSFLKYRAKGKRWYKKEQLRTLYGLTDSAYYALEPYITIDTALFYEERLRCAEARDSAFLALIASHRMADSLFRDSLQKAGILPKYRHEKRDTVLDLNQADTSQLQLIRGIGPYVASEIVRYRRELGGYASVNQLHELAHSDSRLMALDTMTNRFVVTTDSIQPLGVNSSSLRALTNHPYLSFSQAEALYTYRRKHGKFKNMQEVWSLLNLSSEEEIERLRPYLSLEAH